MVQFTDKSIYTPKADASSRVYGFWRSFVLALVLALISASGGFESLDGSLYDFFVRNSPEAGSGARKIVLVESPASAFSDSTIRWDKLADDLVSLGAAQVVFAAVPKGDGAGIGALRDNPKIILGADLAFAPDQSDRFAFSLPPELSSVSPHAASVIPDALQGVHRYQRYGYQVGDKEVPSLEAMVARRLGIKVPQEGRYLVNFRGGLSGFPRMTLKQVLDGGAIREVVRDRVILIGAASEGLHGTVVTPLTAGSREVTELEYHAYALDSLLRGVPIASVHPIAGGLAVIGIWLVCFLMMQSMPFRKAVLTASCMALGLGLASWLLLLEQIHLPVLGSILVVGSTLVLIFQSKTEYQNQALARLAAETNLAVSGRLTGQSGPADADFRSHVLAMVDQMLPLTRVVLLERMDGVNRMQEVRSLRCTIDAIGERRRDFERVPYSTAIEKSEAVEVRNYLTDAEKGEYQFLLPLVWSGKVLGFLAFGIHQSRMANRSTFMYALDGLGKRLSELMFERNQHMMKQGAAPDWREHLIDQRDLSIRQLTRHLNMIDRHIHVFEDMFNGLETPSMVVDLFGRPLFSNVRMKSLLQLAKVDADAQSAAGLLETICGLSVAESRAAIVNVVFDGDFFEQMVQVGGARYRLHVSRLRNSSNSSNSSSAAQAMSSQDVLAHIHGLMIQLFPVADVALQGGGLLPDGTPVYEMPEEAEVDVLHAVEEAIASTALSSEHETVSFAVKGVQGNTRVLAHPKKLKDILTELIRFLAEDSKQSGKLTVTVDTDEDDLVLALQNNGFGMPNEKLQAMLEGSMLPRSDCLRRIKQLRSSAFGTQGQLALRSTVGGGYVAKATMRLAG